MNKDRKGRDIEVGDVVAFDIPVLFGTEAHQNKMWDIFWGVVKEEGIEVEYCPITQKKQAIYRVPEDPSEVLIIKKRPPFMDEEEKEEQSD